MGRKGAFCDEDIKKRFLVAVRMGLSIEKCCNYAGLSEVAFYNWINKAEMDEQKGLKESKYINFVKEYKKAKADFVMRHVSRITEASDNGTWQASAWLLERRCPEEFAATINNKGNEIQKVEIVSDMPAVPESNENKKDV